MPMENNDEADKTLKYLKFLMEFSKKANKIGDQILLQLRDTDYLAMDSFKPYIQPKEKIDKLLEFYDLYSQAYENFNAVKIDIEKSGFFDSQMSLKEMSKIEVLSKAHNLREVSDSMHEFTKVKIVLELQNNIKKYINEMIVVIKKAFFVSLNRLPKVASDVDIYAQFILKNSERKEFLAEYTKEVYSKMGFFDIQNNIVVLVQRTSNLTKYFNLIIEMNVSILGRSSAHNINVGMIQLIMVNLKKIISESLAVVDKNNKAQFIPSLIKLYGNLSHSEGKIVKELEDLFVFRPQINKLILNCLIQFFGDLELLEHPSATLGIEHPVQQMVQILDAFRDNKESKRSWVESFGPSFGVYTEKDLAPNFSAKCIAKIEELSEDLKGVPKYIYLINNYHAFREHLNSYDNQDLAALIEKNCQIIIGLWRINLESKSGSVLSRYLSNELEIHKAYYLPVEHREYIVNLLEQIVENLISRKALEGQSKDILEKIQHAYSGHNNYC
jgi:hypothetical protein